MVKIVVLKIFIFGVSYCNFPSETFNVNQIKPKDINKFFSKLIDSSQFKPL